LLDAGLEDGFQMVQKGKDVVISVKASAQHELGFGMPDGPDFIAQGTIVLKNVDIASMDAANFATSLNF
jgi:hypothetical protein